MFFLIEIMKISFDLRNLSKNKVGKKKEKRKIRALNFHWECLILVETGNQLPHFKSKEQIPLIKPAKYMPYS